MILKLSNPVSKLLGVGETYTKKLKRLKIKTIEDLLYHFPNHYIDYSLISKINTLQLGETVTVRGKIKEIKNEYRPYPKTIQKAIIEDGTGQIRATWFNQPYLINTLKAGKEINLSGKVRSFAGYLTLISPEFEIINSQYRKTIHTGRLTPIYPLTAGVSSKWLRRQIEIALRLTQGQIKEFLPAKILIQENLINEYEAIKKIHFPENQAALKQAQKRLAFDEVFLPQLAAQLRKITWQNQKKAIPINAPFPKLKGLINQLPFTLTNAQKKVVKEIINDLGKNKPMNRLLQGDVGSGKTVVAAIAAYAVWLADQKTILMAPTEILAAQHYQAIKDIMPKNLKIALKTGNQKIGADDFDILIGTHALIFKKKLPSKIGLIIIDEQHRFGVKQRALLIKKSQNQKPQLHPHVLTMTATPIPRSVTLTLYGDLDLSMLDELPPGRQQVKTWIIPQKKRENAYQWIKKQIKNYHCQVFIICPLIEESEKELMKNIRAATTEYKKLRNQIFADLKLALIHGKLKIKEKNSIIKQFSQGKIDILVATPVVEVGIDIPNATIIIIEGTERFGLAQLHQLRGRVGRGKKQSYCLLFPSPNISQHAYRRLRIFQQNNIGIKLAEMDLAERGPGEIFGTAQHGFPKMKIASLTDYQLVNRARKTASRIACQINQFPLLKKKLKKYTIRLVEPN